MWFFFAGAAAICFGIRGILYQWTSQRPIDRNLLLLGVYISGTLIALISNVIAKQPWSNGAWYGVLMGLFSYIANASMYRGYAVGKASIIALFSGLPPLVVVIVAYILWGEVLSTWQLTAFFIVLLGLILIKYSQDLKLNQLKGIQWGILTMLIFGFSDVSIKQSTIAGAATLPALIIMYVTGTVLFGITWAISYAKSKSTVQEKDQYEEAPNKTTQQNNIPHWTLKRTLGWGMFVGITNIAGMMFLFPAFREGITGIVSAISAMSVALVILYAHFYLKENMSKREITGLIVTVVGILVLRLTS
ncbi:EamA family transporter [Peribacillus loiseleuriae]|uniref:Membrane protein n=1 Tax=Peribacillus loiseleuriae TaxID=1679170 RepID=A0A0K9GXG9_9BACI|nr:EamA family transporter [Peribacillus loiseleuriae]KMY51394.1 membrane protein [Peribacillus loiseleuriae]